LESGIFTVNLVYHGNDMFKLGIQKFIYPVL